MARILDKLLQEYFAKIRDAEFNARQAQITERQAENTGKESIIVVAQIRGALHSINVNRNPIRGRYAHVDVPRQRLILNFPVPALQAVADGPLKLADLRSQITITRDEDSPPASYFNLSGTVSSGSSSGR